FIESIAQVMSRALTDDETGLQKYFQLLQFINSVAQSPLQKSFSRLSELCKRDLRIYPHNLKRLEVEAKVRRPFCKHKGTCSGNAIRGLIRAFFTLYLVKYGLSFVPALITGQIWKKPSLMLKIGGKDTISFALFLSVFISSYKAALCTMRRLRPTSDDSLNPFIAGCVAGLSLGLDKNRSRRVMIALYLSTRTFHFMARWFWQRKIETMITGRPSKAVAAIEAEVEGDEQKDTNSDTRKLLSEQHHHQHHSRQHGQHTRLWSEVVNRSNSNSGNGGSGNNGDVAQDSNSRLESSKSQLKTEAEIRATNNHSTSPLMFAQKALKMLTGLETGFLTINADATSNAPAIKQKSAQELLKEDLQVAKLRKNVRYAMGTLVMMFSSSQILMAYVLEPHSLANSYQSFLLTHGGIRDQQPKRARDYLETMAHVIRAGMLGFSTEYLNPTSSSASFSFAGPDGVTTSASTLPPTFESNFPAGIDVSKFELYMDYIDQAPHKYIMCSLEHPAHSSCELGALDSFGKEWKRALQLYIPYYVNGMLCGATVLIEAPGRRLELGLYCLPRALESLWNCGVKWGWWRHIPNGELIYFSFMTGILMTLYQKDPASIHDGARFSSNGAWGTLVLRAVPVFALFAEFVSTEVAMAVH
ncbi:hypothetical protein HK100_003371, partial [Physocladia obscura]